METIKIRYTEPDLIKLEKIQKGCWIDLRAAEDVMLDKGDFALISLGIAMELPVGYEAILASRSWKRCPSAADSSSSWRTYPSSFLRRTRY